MSATGGAFEQHLRPGETVLWSARPSLIGLVPVFAYGAAAVVGILVATYFGLEDPTSLLRGTAGVVVAIGGVLVETTRRFVKLKFTTFVVTDERFYAITSFFETTVRSVPLARATHVSVRQGLTGRLLGLWSAHVGTYGQGGQRDGSPRGLEVPSIRDGEGLLREMGAGMRRGANVGWLRGE